MVRNGTWSNTIRWHTDMTPTTTGSERAPEIGEVRCQWTDSAVTQWLDGMCAPDAQGQTMSLPTSQEPIEKPARRCHTRHTRARAHTHARAHIHYQLQSNPETYTWRKEHVLDHSSADNVYFQREECIRLSAKIISKTTHAILKLITG